MRRLAFASVLALAVLFGTQNQASAAGGNGFGFGFGFGIGFRVRMSVSMSPMSCQQSCMAAPVFFQVPIMPGHDYVPMVPSMHPGYDGH